MEIDKLIDLLEELTIELFYRGHEAPNLMTAQVMLGIAASVQSLTLLLARQRAESTR